jgi:V/A-type H+-transporting ATPase subunit C
MAYEAVNTKIITKKGHILKSEMWEKIFNFNTVDQLSDFFKNHIEIKKVFENLNTNDLHRNNLESLLNKYRTLELEDLIQYFSGPYKDFVKALLIEAEIQDLSLILRKISRNENLNGVQNSFIHSEKYTEINFEKLLNSRSVQQFAENLKQTVYYNDLRNLTNEDLIKREFHIEMKLHLLYYNNLIKKADLLNKDDERISKQIIGYKIDLENAQWIYRALNYYNLTPEEILIYSLKGGNKLNYNRLKKLCYTKTMNEYMKMANSYLKLNFFNEIELNNVVISIDKFMIEYLRKGNFHGIGSILSYYYLLGIIIYDLTSVTEGIKYNIPKEKLKEYLAFKI